MAKVLFTYSVTQLERLWARGDTYQEIAAALGCRAQHVAELRRRHGLPARSCRHVRSEADPTLEQIAERAAVQRAKRERREDAVDRVEAPLMRWDGFRFDRLA